MAVRSVSFGNFPAERRGGGPPLVHGECEHGAEQGPCGGAHMMWASTSSKETVLIVNAQA